jgi:hypothetical protein
MKFTIDPQYICDVTIRKEWGMFDNVHPDDLTHDQLIKIIKGQDRCSMISSQDHPEFAKLRDTLEEQGYIRTQRSWLNGDFVIKPFTLNDIKYKKNDRFLCASALKVAIESAKKYGEKYNPKY